MSPVMHSVNNRRRFLNFSGLERMHCSQRIASRKILPVSTILPPVPLLSFWVWRTLCVGLGGVASSPRFPLVLARCGGDGVGKILPQHHRFKLRILFMKQGWCASSCLMLSYPFFYREYLFSREGVKHSCRVLLSHH